MGGVISQVSQAESWTFITQQQPSVCKQYNTEKHWLISGRLFTFYFFFFFKKPDGVLALFQLMFVDDGVHRQNWAVFKACQDRLRKTSWDCSVVWRWSVNCCCVSLLSAHSVITVKERSHYYWTGPEHISLCCPGGNSFCNYLRADLI